MTTDKKKIRSIKNRIQNSGEYREYLTQAEESTITVSKLPDNNNNN